jgi:hypothetical protein
MIRRVRIGRSRTLVEHQRYSPWHEVTFGEGWGG